MAEMSRFAVAKGANTITFLGLAGMGDLMATCTSKLSRNFQLGELLARDFTLINAKNKIGQVASNKMMQQQKWHTKLLEIMHSKTKDDSRKGRGQMLEVVGVDIGRLGRASLQVSGNVNINGKMVFQDQELVRSPLNETQNTHLEFDQKQNLNIHFRNPVTLISCLINSDANRKFAINITDQNLSENGYHSYNRSKSLLSEYSKNMNFDNEKISIKEFKPGKILPSKNEESSLLKFKQEFEKLIK